jgi:hypothetical protein
MDSKIEQNKSTSFICIKCDVKCSKKYNYDRHCSTARHKRIQMDTKTEQKEEIDVYVCHCGNKYKYRQGLSKHKKNCIPSATTEPTDKEMMMTLIKQNSELHAKVIELCKTGVTNNTVNTHTNSHNKTFNLQFFLNETCKNAMNISDFIESVVLQLSDIEDIGEVGYAKGISNIIISKLNSLGETNRPIHCTDVKREVMYVKDEDKWEKDANKEKMRLLIKKMDKKLAPVMIAFANNHRKEYHTDSEIINHQKVMYEVLGGVKEDADNEDAIIQQIAKNSTIAR